MTMMMMLTTVISMTLSESEKSSAFHSWPRLLSTLISLFALSTVRLTSLAITFSLPPSLTYLPSPAVAGEPF